MKGDNEAFTTDTNKLGFFIFNEYFIGF